MSTTVGDLIKGAFRIIGVLAAEETPSASEQSDAFNALNDLLDSWANEELMLFATSRKTYTLTPGLNPHTFGSSGSPTFTDTRPLRIERASIVLASSSNAELPLAIQSDADWQITQGKTMQGTPAFLWVKTTYPLLELWLNPIPVNADTLVLYTWKQLPDLTGLTAASALDLPPGYLRALRFNLAKELAAEYGATLSAEASDIANESKAYIKRVNTKPSYLRSDSALLRRGPFNIISGDR